MDDGAELPAASERPKRSRKKREDAKKPRQQKKFAMGSTSRCTMSASGISNELSLEYQTMERRTRQRRRSRKSATLDENR